MEINKDEVVAVEMTAAEATTGQMLLLNELQMTLIGGGNAMVDFA